jgi:Flp pilus assembly pilin Flp
MELVRSFVAKGLAAIEYALIAVAIVVFAAVALDVLSAITSGLDGSAVSNLLLGH